MISTGSRYYFVHAIGYLDYDDIKAYTGNEKNFDAFKDVFLNGNSRSKQITNTSSEGAGVLPGRNDGSNGGTSNDIPAMGYGEVDGEGETFAADDSSTYYGYGSLDELFDSVDAGSMVMDDNGEIIYKTIHDAAGVAVDSDTESVSPLLFSERTWTESDYVQDRNKAAKEIAEKIGVSERKAKA